MYHLKTGAKMKFKLLINSDEFWEHLKNDIAHATDSIRLQTLSFEADSVGKSLSDYVQLSNAKDKMIIVDSMFTRFMHNDKFLLWPLNFSDRQLYREAKKTRRTIRELNKSGVMVKYVNKPGFLFHKVFVRNHKKIITIDGSISYLGGINFCEHNFEWHDMMLRIESPDIAMRLERDFMSTWNDESKSWTEEIDGVMIHSLNGTHNAGGFLPIFDLIANAKESIMIESPYLSFPFYKRLGDARRRGVDVTLVTSMQSNWHFFSGYTRRNCKKYDIDLKLFKINISHLKAMLIDDEILVMGSSNFDWFSYRFNAEIIVVIRDEELINNFKERVLSPDIKNSIAYGPLESTNTSVEIRNETAI